MSSKSPSPSSKKRKYPFEEKEKKSKYEDEDLGPKGSKKPKPRHEPIPTGYFVSTKASDNDKSMAVDGEGIEENGSKLLPEDKKEISDLLDDIEARKRKKREKRALRRTNPPVLNPAEPTTQSSIDYLKEWHEDRKNWKFKSAREAWLIRHYNDTKMVCVVVQFNG
jgi:hypothetical protein